MSFKERVKYYIEVCHLDRYDAEREALEDMREEQQKKMYNVYMQAGLTVYVFAKFDNYDDAFEFCELYDWKYVDENDVEWFLDMDAI